MKIANFNTSSDGPLIIAEIGNNHEGNFEAACKLIEQAAWAGVDAVKFQTFRTELYVSSREEERFKRLKRFELTFDQFSQLAEVAREHNVIFLSTPFDLESAAFLNSIAPGFKIGSGENTFKPLLEFIASTGKPAILSTGLAGVEDIQIAKGIFESTWSKLGTVGELSILHCVSAYPVPAEAANLQRIVDLKREFQVTTGYSDHTLGTEACVLAVALGAEILEKHFTLSKTTSDFRDHQLSAEPEEMKELVRRVREAKKFLQRPLGINQNLEDSARVAMRRSVIAKRVIAQGTKLSLEDVTWVRPGGGLAPGQEALLLGKVAKRDIGAGELLSADFFD